MSTQPLPVSDPSTPFQRVLSLWTLVLFGLAFVGPTAPFTFFGIGTQKSQGHFALVYLIALIAVSFTALSYARMATAFPEAGSAYAYANRAIHPFAGFMTGWIMLLDYIFLPLLCVIIISANLSTLVPWIPYPGSVLLCALLMTGVNLSSIKTTSFATVVFNIVLALAVTWFVAAAIRWLLLYPVPESSSYLKPFFNPQTFSLSAVMATTPIAVLSFLGFDAISTLAEDAKSPKKNIGRATLLVCLIAGSIFILLTWLAQLVRPGYTSPEPVETAFAQIGNTVGGVYLYYAIAGLVIAQAWASGITSQASSSRLLHAMSRDGRLPRFFAFVHPVRRTPTYTLVFMGAITALGALSLNLDRAAQLVNFGACIAFMAVNIAVVGHYFLRLRMRSAVHLLTNLLAPSIGFLVCLYIWLNVSRIAMWIGFCWSAVGVLYYRFSNGTVPTEVVVREA